MSRNTPVNPCLLKYTNRSNHEAKHHYVLRSLGAHSRQGGVHPGCRNGDPVCARQNVANVGTGAVGWLMEKVRGGKNHVIIVVNCAREIHRVTMGVQMKLHNQTGERYVD